MLIISMQGGLDSLVYRFDCSSGKTNTKNIGYQIEEACCSTYQAVFGMWDAGIVRLKMAMLEKLNVLVLSRNPCTFRDKR
jgi:hypothetical protein